MGTAKKGFYCNEGKLHNELSLAIRKSVTLRFFTKEHIVSTYISMNDFLNIFNFYIL